MYFEALPFFLLMSFDSDSRQLYCSHSKPLVIPTKEGKYDTREQIVYGGR